MIDEKLYEFCKSETQSKVLDALIECDGKRGEAARRLGISERNVYRALERIRNNAALKGYAPDYDLAQIAAPGFSVKGVSTLYDQDGEKRAQWIKTSADAQREQDIREAIFDAFSEWKGTAKPVPAPKSVQSDLLNVLPFGDPHLGLYAWHEDAGDDFDLKIAEQNLCEAVQRLVECAPQSETTLLLNLGDFFHADNSENRTMRSGHSLDVDTRWTQVMRVGVKTMMNAIETAARRSNNVVVRNCPGNHDDHSSIMLSAALAAYYHDDPRITIDESPARFWYYRFGRVLIGATHGDQTKPAQLPGIMATDRPEDWGQTDFRYFLTGHIHQHNQQEFPGMVWQSFRTLAPADSWAHGRGYRSGRDSWSLVFHRQYGEQERHRVDVSLLNENQASRTS